MLVERRFVSEIAIPSLVALLLALGLSYRRRASP